MKKKLLALVTTFIMIFSFAGCSAEGTALLKEMETVSKWEATEQSGTMNFEVQATDTKVNFALDYTAYTIPETLQMEMTVNPKTCSIDGKDIDLTKGTYKISPVKIYMDGFKFYVSSAFIKEVCGIAAVDPSTSGFDLSKEYIAYDISDVYAQMGMDVKEIAKDSANMSKELFAELEKAGVAVPIKQEGKKFTVELSAEEMVSAGLKLYAKSLEMQKDTLEKTYKEMGLSEEEIKQAMAMASAMASDEVAKEINAAVKGSKVKYTVEYKDDAQNTEMTFDIKVTADEESVTLKFDMKDVAKKVAKKEVTMPKDVKVYTMNDLMNLAAEQATTEEVNTAETKDATATDTKAA